MAVQADEWAWGNLDFLVIFAAGNSGTDKDKNGKIDEGSISSPGTAKNILTVGASENQVFKGGIQRPIKDLRLARENWPAEPIYSSFLSDNPRGIVAFSSRGPTRDQRLKPEVVAPGSNILSSFSQEPGASTLWGAYDAFYVFSGGTSMSTPLVAGAAAITRQILVERGSVGNPSSSLIKALLMLGSEDLYPGQYGTGAYRELDVRPDNHQGFGLVQLPKVKKIIESGHFLEGVVRDITQPFTHSVTLSAGDELEALLVYTDAPGTTNSGRALVNDLDLDVSGPGGLSLVSQSQVNNFEYLKLKASVTGQYVLRVLGARIVTNHPKVGGQPFSLVFDRH
jgi:subtilisin family serine protease